MNDQIMVNTELWDFIKEMLGLFYYTVDDIESFQIRFVALGNDILLHMSDFRTVYITGLNTTKSTRRIFTDVKLLHGHVKYSQITECDTPIESIRLDIPRWCYAR